MKPLSLMLLAAGVASSGIWFCQGSGTQPQQVPGVDAALLASTADKAIAFLKSTQEPDGGWSTKAKPRRHRHRPDRHAPNRQGRRPRIRRSAKALKYIEAPGQSRRRATSPARTPRCSCKNYVTSVNVMALAAANRPTSYKQVIGDAVKFLKKLQWDEDEGKTPKDDFYGGAGYDSKSRPDLSNTQFFLDALKAAGVPKDDPALQEGADLRQPLPEPQGRVQRPALGRQDQRRQLHLQRRQPAATPRSTTSATADDGLPGYGSMTYAGIKSMIYCGVIQGRPARQEGLRVDPEELHRGQEPRHARRAGGVGPVLLLPHDGQVPGRAGRRLRSSDAKGDKHDWRADITAALAKRQRPDGSFVNDTHWMEADPNLVTGYALMALSYCRPASTKAK